MLEMSSKQKGQFLVVVIVINIIVELNFASTSYTIQSIFID